MEKEQVVLWFTLVMGAETQFYPVLFYPLHKTGGKIQQDSNYKTMKTTALQSIIIFKCKIKRFIKLEIGTVETSTINSTRTICCIHLFLMLESIINLTKPAI